MPEAPRQLHSVPIVQEMAERDHMLRLEHIRQVLDQTRQAEQAYPFRSEAARVLGAGMLRALDTSVFVDRGLPSPESVRRGDLVVSSGSDRFVQSTNTVAITGNVIGIQADSKRGLLRYMERESRRRPVSPWPLRVGMPCGQSIDFSIGAELPSHSMPCPCGDETHWFIKYTEESSENL